MSALLEILQEARELRDTAEREFRLALKRAAEQRFRDPTSGKLRTHSLAELAGAAGLTRQGVHWILKRERERDS